MKNSDPSDMAGVLSALCRQNRSIREHMVSHKVSVWWEKEYPAYAPYTKEIKYDGTYMTFRITSDALRHTLSMSREEIRCAINSLLGEDAVYGLCFL